jgi:hypothetical protein
MRRKAHGKQGSENIPLILERDFFKNSAFSAGNFFLKKDGKIID